MVIMGGCLPGDSGEDLLAQPRVGQSGHHRLGVVSCNNRGRQDQRVRVGEC